MDRLQAAIAGFQTIDADAASKQQAARNLERWLTEPEFAPYKPQIEWLIDQQKWAGLLDRFYQILPFGTGGRRGAVGIGPNRMNLWTLGASVQGHCEYLQERFPEHAETLRRAGLRRAPIRGPAQELQPEPAQSGAASVVEATSPSTPPASMRPTASTPTSCPTTARATWRRRSCRLRFALSRRTAA